ncbi:MAG TPA: hypothetical protein VN880_17400 [Solirubrobacteraceae bacterium]|jgi:hypothetical protein|nr:hypothetical protein [Solirubrobacteraceae bacterium]
MAVKTKTKAKLGAKTAKTAAKNPRIVRAVGRVAFKVGKPVAKRKVRRHAKRVSRRTERVGATARTAAEWVVVFGPIAAQAAGLVAPPKRQHIGMRVVAGVVLGATAMYFLRGGDRRQGPKPVP